MAKKIEDGIYIREATNEYVAVVNLKGKLHICGTFHILHRNPSWPEVFDDWENAMWCRIAGLTKKPVFKLKEPQSSWLLQFKPEDVVDLLINYGSNGQAEP